MSMREMALTVLAQKDMEDFIKRHIIDELPVIEAAVVTPKAVFIAIANFPGKFHFQRMLDAWVHESHGVHRVVADRYEVNKLRGQRFDVLWIDFRLGPRMSWEDLQYLVEIVSPATKRLIVTHNSFILHNHETNEYDMYASLSFEDFISVVREDSWTMKIEGVTDPRLIKRRQPLRIRYLLKRAILRLFGKDNN